ncbi:CRISPR associated protein Cas6 [Clostridium tepidiprofundi DSM 19306]|uniref:CRISPR associated protein Cas6 n=1 Tax=Clostridium tepidiprofundi DSM 19306 TaxID=1121338 RepID=A0A151B2G6_9CLOT|nr:CRISPR associated protein Cas6 [Clostridium tepidiprofundi DSM 19306]
MRLSCEYKTDKFPIAYQMMIVSLIKEALNKTDKEYFLKLYTYENGKANKKTKNFCFSVFLKDFKKEGEVFTINDKVIINISSPDYEFMIKLYNGLLKIKTFEYKEEFSINKVRINLQKEKEINSSTILFNTLSPICIKNKNNEMLEIDHEDYEKELNYIANKTLESFRGYGLKENLKFKAVNMKKRVVKEQIRNFKEKTGKPFYYVNSYVGVFQLQGDVNDIKDIYSLGLGFKRSQGFGMIEVVG